MTDLTGKPVSLHENDIEAAAEVLATAFLNEALMAYAIPDMEKRREYFPSHFRAFIQAGLLFGKVFTTSHLRAVAVWFPPEKTQLTRTEEEAAGLTSLEERLPSGAFSRFRSVMEYLRKLHDADASEPHWYLSLLGVAPDVQGRGIGSTLMRPTLEMLDDQRLPCYLETVQRRSVPFYERLGFQVVRHGMQPATQIQFWTLKRTAH